MRADIRLELGKAPPPGKRPKEELGEPEQLDITYNISNINRDTPTGTSRNYTIRRLKSEGHEELANKVARKEISTNAAAIEAGFRKKTGAFYPEDINRTARVLLKHFDPDELIEALVKLKRAQRRS